MAALSFADAALTVDIPVLYEGNALDPQNFTGSSGAKVGNSVVWQVPASNAGTLSYSFLMEGSISKASFTYSGIVSQDYTTAKPTPPTPPSPSPTPLAPTGDDMSTLLFTFLSLVAISAFVVATRRLKV